MNDYDSHQKIAADFPESIVTCEKYVLYFIIIVINHLYIPEKKNIFKHTITHSIL